MKRWVPLMQECIAEWKRRTGNAECHLSPNEFARQMDAMCGVEHINGRPEVCAARWLKALRGDGP